jgi:fructose-1,6-bisphosphatase-3
MMPLANFAGSMYGDDPCDLFKIHHIEREDYSISQVEEKMEEKMHKAIAIIQFKLEGQIMMRRPEFKMADRLLLDKIDYEKGIITIEGKDYDLLDHYFPTIDPENPYELSAEEADVMDRLVTAFKSCEKLQKHVQFLFKHGSLYLCYNDNLYYHGCVPFNEDGTFRNVTLGGQQYSGRSLYDFLENCARKGYYMDSDSEEKLYGQDIMWFIWSNVDSPVYGKEKMATFERYFINEPSLREERKDYYYKLIEREEICDMIIREFGLNPENAHIVNGHMPVKFKAGESPIKGNGKLLIIDGGFSKAYQNTTGIAGYTLIYNSYGLRLVTHEPFESLEKAIIDETDIHSNITVVEKVNERRMVADTDIGHQLKKDIESLERLLDAYRSGLIREKR